MDNRPIGFFDSGLGGLSCLPSLLKKMPNEKVVYYGDTARTPYGSKSTATIEKFSFQISDYLVEHNVKMIVIACNTISATCLDALRRRHPQIPIIGVIEPIAQKIARDTSEETKIGVIGTKVTISSGAYANQITSRNKKVKLFSKACPAFVPLIEEGIIDDEIMDLTIKHYLDDFISDNGITKLVLGCTHYPFLTDNLHRIYPDLELLNPSQEVINTVQEILQNNDQLAGPNSLEHQCFASDLSEVFMNMISRIFNDESDVTVNIKNFED